MINKAAYEQICLHRKHFNEEEILQMDLAEEGQMKKTQRNYSLLNRDHWNMILGSDPKSVKTKKVLVLLKKEKKNISTDLKIATSFNKIKQDGETMTRIKELMEENRIITKEVQNREREIKEIETTIQRVQREVQKLKNGQVTDDALTRRTVEGQRIIDNLENKLDVQVQKFGQIDHENKKLREQIDHLLNDRTNFTLEWERAMKKLNKGKTIIADLLQQCTVAYNQRDEVVSTLNALRSKSHSDFVRDCEEMQNLQRTYEYSVTKAKFIETKEQKRLMGNVLAAHKRKRYVENSLMKINIEKYSEIITQILNYYQVKYIERIPLKFEFQQIENYSKLKLILNLNSEIEDVGKELQLSSDKIQKQQELDESRREAQEKSLENLKIRLEQAAEKIKQSENECQRMDDLLTDIFKKIKQLFTLTKCDLNPFILLLGGNEVIHRFNVLIYVEALQQKISENVLYALFKQKTIKKKDKDKLKTELVIKENRFYPQTIEVDDYVEINPCSLCVEQEMVSDVIDTLQFAFTIEEVKQYLKNRLSLPDGSFSLHTVSHCNLPKSREIIQKRFM